MSKTKTEKLEKTVEEQANQIADLQKENSALQQQLIEQGKLLKALISSLGQSNLNVSLPTLPNIIELGVTLQELQELINIDLSGPNTDVEKHLDTMKDKVIELYDKLINDTTLNIQQVKMSSDVEILKAIQSIGAVLHILKNITDILFLDYQRRFRDIDSFLNTADNQVSESLYGLVGIDGDLEKKQTLRPVILDNEICQAIKSKIHTVFELDKRVRRAITSLKSLSEYYKKEQANIAVIIETVTNKRPPAINHDAAILALQQTNTRIQHLLNCDNQQNFYSEFIQYMAEALNLLLYKIIGIANGFSQNDDVVETALAGTAEIVGNVIPFASVPFKLYDVYKAIDAQQLTNQFKGIMLDSGRAIAKAFQQLPQILADIFYTQLMQLSKSTKNAVQKFSDSYEPHIQFALDLTTKIIAFFYECKHAKKSFQDTDAIIAILVKHLLLGKTPTELEKFKAKFSLDTIKCEGKEISISLMTAKVLVTNGQTEVNKQPESDEANYGSVNLQALPDGVYVKLCPNSYKAHYDAPYQHNKTTGTRKTPYVTKETSSKQPNNTTYSFS